jgi:SAM-dependent methyltransferase
MPIDEEERVRQYAIHETYLRLFNKQLTTVPLNDPRYILDIGTGIGEWAIAMAERYPRAEVFGTDIAPIQPTHQVPFNVEFHIEDAEDEWIRPADTVDLVHLRNLEGAFSDWSFIYSQAFACLKPGGWIEILDWDNVLSNGNFLSCFPDDSPAHQLVSAVLRAAEIAGKPRDAGHLDPALLRASGFVDVRETVYDLSMSTHDDAAASYRQFWLFSVVTGFEPMCLRMLTKYLGMDPDEAKSLCREVAMETKKVAEDPQRAQHFVVKLRVVVARKPLPGEEMLQQQHQRFREVNGSARDLSGDESTIGPATIQSDDTI